MKSISRKGFTLVELIIVLVIVGILAAAGIPTASHFIKLAEFRKNEENARTAYLAAEAALTWYRSSGEWESFCRKVTEKGALNDTFAADNDKSGRIYSVTIENGQPLSGSGALAMELLDKGVYSKDFFNAAIAIEIDVKTGQVYSAFYGTRCSSLSYSGTDENGVLNISAAGDNRSYDSRRGRLLGYYSVEDVTNVVELKPVRLKVTTINLVNSETLSLNWASNSRYDNLDVKFLISFYQKDSNGDRELFSTEVDWKNLVKTGEKGSQTVSLALKTPQADGGSKDIGSWTFPLSYQAQGKSGGRFSLVLDGMMTAELMGSIKAKENESPEAGAGIARQYSTGITRLGGEIAALKEPVDIYAQIEVEPTYAITGGEFIEYTPGGAVKSNVENTLYGKSEEKGGSFSAEISRFRHLSNIRYYDADKKAEFTLSARNLDWTAAGVGVYGLSAAAPGEGGGESLRTLVFTGSRNGDEVLDFPSVELLSENHTLSGRGSSTVISNLSLGEASMPGDDQMKALYPAETESHRTNYLGLFCETEGTIKGITLSNPILTLGEITAGMEGAPEVKAAENFASLYGVGILSGRNQGTLEDISVKTAQKDSPVLTVCLKNREEKKEDAPDDKPAAIGGLVGVLAGKKDDGTLEALTDAGVKISGLTMEGSITGVLPAPYAEESPSGQAEGGMASAFRAAEEKSPEQRAPEYSYGIGGIFGYGWLGDGTGGITAGKRVQIENSQNHAGVTGNLFTGGICGHLRDDFDTALAENTQGEEGSIVNCGNDGLILCSAEKKEEDNALEGRYFGGILGFGDKVRVNDSASASGRAKNYSYTFAQKEQVLLGQYVGGIIGYGNSSRLAGCKTEKGGYVLGSDYVGGIAGGLSNDAREAITGTSGIAVTTNAGYVIGNRYVGGIVGKNDGEQETTITNCINNGVAAGYDCFIGGIAGYNGENGRLLDCASYLSDYSGELLATITNKWQATGDCAGGLVGYNNGKIEFTEESEKITVKSVSSIVVGRDYVGGVIGFNDDKGTLDVNYTLIGGRIYAFGNGAGGCIGLNASTEILGKELSIRPSEVTGNYYVGGCIGANVVDLTAKDGSGAEKAQDILMEGFRADNTLGGITGRAFTGGVIGYQRTYKKEQLKSEGGEDISLPVYLDMTGKKDGAGSEGSGAAGENLLPLLPGLDGQNVPTKVLPSENTFTLIIGNNKNTSEKLTDDNNNIPVYSDLYVGGIVGYCERNSKLVIVNCKNSGRLSKYERKEEGSGTEDGSGAGNSSETQKAVSNVSLQAYLESGEVNADISELEAEDIRVSVGGGIIGANLDNQIIDHCVNTGTMNGFIGLGGIVGFNAGGVFNCELSDNFGNAGLSYIGGIVGLNVKADTRGAGNGNTGSTSADGQETGGKVRLYRDTLNREWSYTSGMVARCLTRENRNISGNSCVGGIAGFNLSGAVLEANENRANVTAAGNYAGGIAGANSGNILTASGSQAQEDSDAITISGDAGEGIGGIAGWNKNTGNISVYAGADETKAEPEVVAIGSNVTVSGREKVGGIVGINEGTLDTSQNDGSIRFLVCKAKLVHATDDYAGGIIGEAKAGNGEAGVQSKKILRAVNRSVGVTADNGRAGGIVAVNAAGFALEECKNIGNVNSDNGYAGGIAAENFGEIINCSVGDEYGKDEVLIRSQGADAIGAVCAVNYGQIRDSAPVKNMTAGAAEVTLSGTADLIGGIAGKNAAGGVIGKTYQSGFEVTYMPKLDISASPLTVGGIAGLNEGGALDGGDEPGDAAGADGEPESREARIEEIRVRGLIFKDFKNYRYLGGIAGENRDGGRVKDCLADGVTIGQKSGSEAGNCYGGIAGRNSGILEDSGIKAINLNIQGVYTAVSTSTAEEKERLSTHIGGIAGKNEESGRIIGCLIENTGKKETVIHVQSGMAGGIAGYNKGSIEMSGDEVTKELMQDASGGGDVRINDVQDLIEKAKTAGIKADGNYVAWSNVGLENQYYAGSSGKVSDGRSLSLIVAANGNLGGITAYNAPTGRVNYCATGNWYLNNKSQAIGVGTGGVIGMNESGQNLSFVLNQAFVGRELSAGDTNRFAGGIIGNQNNSTGSGWMIQGCVNYGTVYCRNTHYSGGIMGQWTSSGGTIEKCYNYGNLQTTYQAGWVGAAAGIVAQLYHAYENNEYNILSCGNYGNIYGRNGRNIADCANDSAGILGNVTAYRTGNAASAQNYTINVTDCVNGAGVEIYSGSMASGIVGFFSCDNPNAGIIATSTANIALNIERCRNYAAVLKGQQFVAGIFGDRYGEAGSAKTSLKYCFSVNRQTGNYNKADYPVISYATGNSKPGQINGGDKQNIYNYFLSENTVNSFLTTDTVNSNSQNASLQRANTGWVYSTAKSGKQYFIYLNTGIGSINNVSFDGLEAGDEIKQNGKVIGHVLFITPTQYKNMASVINPGSDFDTYVRTFCYTQAGMLLSPEKVTLSKEAGNQLTIEVEAPAYPGGEVEYVAALYRKGAKEGEETLIALSEIILGADAAAGPGDSFTFDAKTCTFEISEKVINEGGELFVKVKAVQKGGGKESPQVDSNLVAIGNTLPEPRIRIELTGAGNSGSNYRFSLDNLEDYEEYTDNPGYANLQAAVQMMNGTKITFKLNEKGVHADLKTESLEQLLVWVEEINVPPADKGMSSAQVSVPVYLPAPLPAISLRNNNKTWVEPSCTVTGSSLEDLRIAVTLEGKGGNVTTPTVYRAELTGTWKDENGNTYDNTVFQSSDLLATTSGAATAVFTDLPEYMVDASDLHVRVWYAESGLGPVYTYSKYLADDSEADGNSPNAARILTGTLTETPDGEQYDYDWQYEYTPVWQENTFTDYRWISQKPLFTFLPAPKLMELPAGSDTLEPATDPDTGHLQYTFKWDENEYKPGNKYTVSLAGLVKDEDGNVTRRVSIVTSRELPEAESGEPANSITLDAENWSYNEVELTVTRKGDAGKNEIGLTSSRTYGVKRRLQRPAQPGVNNPDINELNYEIEFPAITPEDGCEYYEIYVQPYNEDGMTLGESIMAAKVPVRNDAGESNADENGIYRQMVNLEQAGENSVDCAGRRVLIYIKAYPAGDSALYVHSVDGVTYGLDVPARLKKPEITWEKNWKYERDSAKTVEGFQGEGQEEADGLKVTVNAGNGSIPPGGSSYLTKAYVFDSEDAAKNAKAEIERGSLTDIEGLLEVYPSLREDTLVPAQMDTESADKYSHSLLGLSAEYAGKYVLFYARISSGQGNISSPWVCSDESEGIWRLPYVKLQTPEVTVANEGYDRDVTLIFNPDLQDTTAFKAKKETENQDGSGEDEKEASKEEEENEPLVGGEDGETEPSEEDASGDGEDGEKESSEAAGDGNEKEPSEAAGDENEKEPLEDAGDENEKEPSEAAGDENEKESSEAAGDENKKEPSENAGVMNLTAAAGRTYGRTVFTRLSGRAGNAFIMRTETEVEDILPEDDEEILPEEEESLYYAGEEEAPEIDVQADTPTAGKEESIWTADSTTLSWSSVRFADSSYLTLTDRKQGTQEFKIKETVTDDGNGGATASAAVFWKNESGDWEEITGNDGVYELSQYHKEIEGQYEKETGFKVPYKVDLTAGLKVEALEDNRFAYTLILPDADRLTPKEDGGNSIESDELRFTQSVEICADVEENETSPGSDAYVRSDAYKVEF